MRYSVTNKGHVNLSFISLFSLCYFLLNAVYFLSAHLKKKNSLAWSCSDWFWDNAHNISFLYPKLVCNSLALFQTWVIPFCVHIFHKCNVYFSITLVNIYLFAKWSDKPTYEDYSYMILIQKWKSRNIILHAIPILYLIIFSNKNMNKRKKTAQRLKRKKIYKHVHHEPH